MARRLRADQAEKIQWGDATHEHRVEALYEQNAHGYTDVHGHYLNFGFWEPGNTDYVLAAESLVYRMAVLLELRPGHRLLDVACGWGAQDFFLQNEFGPIQIDAVDVTWSHIRWAQAEGRKQKLSGPVRFKHGSATHLQFVESTFDRVLCIEGSVHFDTRARFLAEAHRVLKPGGRIALADYVLKREPANRFERAVLDGVISLWKIPQANAVTAEGYSQSLRDAGFGDERVELVGEKTIPGYYYEQRNPRFRLHKIRTQGWVGGLSFVLDFACFQAYRMGLIDYVLVTARKS
jgi:erythromycin 3''-O-methyltransferase